MIVWYTHNILYDLQSPVLDYGTDEYQCDPQAIMIGYGADKSLNDLQAPMIN